MAEMVRHEVDGLLFAPGDSADLLRTLRRVLDDPALLDRLGRTATGAMTIDGDAGQLRDLYRNLPAPPRPRRRLAAVVLNYRAPHETLLAVRSLARSRRPVDRIVVVDNGSEDGSAGWLRANLPAEATLLESGANLGFSSGCNVGIRDALGTGAELVFLLNGDAMVARDTLGRLEEALESSPNAAIAGPRLLAANDPSIVASAGMRFSPTTGRMRHVDAGLPLDRVASGGNRDVAGVAGCAMLVDRAAFDAAGLLDEDYFFSFEDLAFALRAKRAGLRCVLASDAVAYHIGSRSIGTDSPDRYYFAARNHLLMARREAPTGLAPGAIRFLTIVALNLAHALTTGASPIPAVAAVLRGTADHLRGRYGAVRRFE
jgi:GT2 family glycosyltransferase